jgi:hypothetical protein
MTRQSAEELPITLVDCVAYFLLAAFTHSSILAAIKTYIEVTPRLLIS